MDVQTVSPIAGQGLHVTSREPDVSPEALRVEAHAIPNRSLQDCASSSGDAQIRSQIIETFHEETWIADELIRVCVQRGIVHFTGEVDDPHAVIALRRIATRTRGVRAIIDELWTSCE